MSCEPFLRWAGGKRWLAEKCAPLLTDRLEPNGRYIEPFLGSGALYFAVGPTHALLGDSNLDLIETFDVVRNDTNRLSQKLLSLGVSEAEYYRVRAWSPRTTLNRAARFIYLNRTGYGGLHRTNRKGEFNVPYGGGERNAHRIVQTGILRAAADCLRSSELEVYAGDFEVPISNAGEGDIIYCDPTYRALTRTVYDRYGPLIYSWQDQVRLAALIRAAHARGALVLVSSQASAGLSELFPDAGLIELRRTKGLGTTANQVRLTEYIFVLDPAREWSRWAHLGHVILRDRNRRIRTQCKESSPLGRSKNGGVATLGD